MYLCTRFPGWNGSSHCSQTQSLTPTYLYTHMRYTIYPVHTTYFVQRLLVRSVRQQVAKPQVLLMSQQNCSKQEERQHWTECTEYVWCGRSGKLVSGQRNVRSPHSSHFPRKVTLNSVKTTEQLLWFPMQARYFSASYWKGSKWRPKQKLQTSRQGSDKVGGLETRSRI